MNIYNLVIKNLYHYRKLNFSLLLGTMVTSTIIIGSLIIGDSIRYSLKKLTYQRLGNIEFSLQSREYLFRASLAEKMAVNLKTVVSPLLILKGIVSKDGGLKRYGNVQVNGIEDSFWNLNPEGKKHKIKPGYVLINFKLAELLDLKKDDEFLIKINNPSSLPKDSPFSINKDAFTGLRLKVQDILDKDNFGSFSLKMNHVTSPEIFISISYLSEKIDLKNKANTLLLSQNNKNSLDINQINKSLKSFWSLEDLALNIKQIPNDNFFEISTERIFIPGIVSKTVEKIYPDARFNFSYFVNSIRKNDKTTPYSILSSPPPSESHKINDDEIVINKWLAKDLDVKKDDNLEIEYFIIDSKRKLQTRRNIFKVNSIIPIKGSAADKTLMPDFPGLSNQENCRDWHPGIPIDLNKIRKKDEAYWKDYKGTPKAFITLKKAKELWKNQFGDLTNIRFQTENKDEFINKLTNQLGPEKFGLTFIEIKKLGIKSSEHSVDFSQLFLGLSFFIVIASLILTSLFFIFYLEQRFSEIGTLYALGFSKKNIKKIFLMEGVLISISGSLAGILISIFYDKIILYALSTMWIDAVRTTDLKIYLNPVSITTGFLLSILFSTVVMIIELKRILKENIIKLQKKSETIYLFKNNFPKTYKFLSIFLILMIIITLIYFIFTKISISPIFYFILGILLLLEGQLISRFFMFKLNSMNDVKKLSIKNLGLKNINRKFGTNLSIIGLFSISIFIIVSISSNRHNLNEKNEKSTSGTGGFDLFCETTYPVNYNLNDKNDRKKLLLDENIFTDVKFVQARLLDGDDASCLNLNQAVIPRVIGINPDEFSKRGAFTFTKVLDGLSNKAIHKDDFWSLLNLPLTLPLPQGERWKKDDALPHAEGWKRNDALPHAERWDRDSDLPHEEMENADEVIPVIADQTVIQWGLNKKIGDSITYIDDNGKAIKLRFVAGLANSIFQGNIIISENNFMKHFSSVSGFKIFLIDNVKTKNDKIINSLNNSLMNYGISITNTSKRLAEFNSVENSYLSIFLVLGGLGLILGTIGLGVLLLRNIFERKGELMVLKVLGYNQKSILKMLMFEYMFLLICGMIIGTVSGLLSVLPVLLKPGANVPYLLLITIISAMVITGFFSIYLTGFYQTKNISLKDLREE